MKLLGSKAEVAEQPTGGRVAQREARRAAAKRVAHEAIERKRLRKTNLVERVEAAKKKLEGANVPTTLQLIESLAPTDRDIYILAEELGMNRKTILRQLGPGRGSVRDAYFASLNESAPSQ